MQRVNMFASRLFFVDMLEEILFTALVLRDGEMLCSSGGVFLWACLSFRVHFQPFRTEQKIGHLKDQPEQ